MERFLDRFNPHFEAIEGELGRFLESRPSLVRDIASYALLGQGKRLRPLLFVLSARLCGFQDHGMYRFSTIFELLHTASLLHDDVLDHADLRRKKPSVPQVWGNPAAVLGGDYLYSLATIIATEFENLDVIRMLSENMKQMVEGQLLELAHTHDFGITKESYLQIITAKTAVLISSACASGALMAGSGKKEVERLGRFGLNIGIAFQLMDDVLDYTASEEEFGKPVGKDLREGKITLPLIYFFSEKTKADVNDLQDLFKSSKAGDEDYQRLIALVREKGVIRRIQREAEEYVARGNGFLDVFPESRSKQDLLGLGRYIIARRH
jgi:octaprenyl-diphosphate synthase